MRIAHAWPLSAKLTKLKPLNSNKDSSLLVSIGASLKKGTVMNLQQFLVSAQCIYKQHQFVYA